MNIPCASENKKGYTVSLLFFTPWPKDTTLANNMAGFGDILTKIDDLPPVIYGESGRFRPGLYSQK